MPKISTHLYNSLQNRFHRLTEKRICDLNEAKQILSNAYEHNCHHGKYKVVPKNEAGRILIQIVGLLSDKDEELHNVELCHEVIDEVLEIAEQNKNVLGKEAYDIGTALGMLKIYRDFK